MEIRILGAHGGESKTARCTSFLVDGILAIDAGGLAANLPLSAQKRLESVLVTHAHFDHIKDIPLVALNLYRMNDRIRVHSIPEVIAAVSNHLLDGTIYPLLQKLPAHEPTVTFHKITPYEEQQVGAYRVLAVPVNHTVPTVGYQVRDAAGRALFYTADTGPGLAGLWGRLSFQLLIIDTSFPDSYEDYARYTGHLTPKLLKDELTALREARGSLPQIITVHRDPLLEKEVAGEVAGLAAALGVPITVAREGMRFTF